MHIRETPQYEVKYNSGVRYVTFNNVFNATYNSKSDIWTKYSHPLIFVKNVNMKKVINKNYADRKTIQAAWIVSHCHTYSGRDDYVRNLQ